MPRFETDSIILRSYNLAEADRIVVFFTREHGLVRGVAKGARRLQSRFGSALEPFSEVRLAYFQKEDRELVSLENAELMRSAFASASLPDQLATFSYIADLLQAFAPPHDPNETLYRMIRACLDLRPASDAERNGLRLYFEVWLLRLSGYLPDWNSCRKCGNVIAAGGDVTLAAGNELLCGTCRIPRAGDAISSDMRALIRDIRRLSPDSFIASSASGFLSEIDELSAIMRRIIAGALGRPANGVIDLSTAA